MEADMILMTGHELTSTSPKLAISWYAVGCYYYSTKKYELSQKYLTKASKLDKRFVYAWIALGHCLSEQQESEHAVSSYRSAVRLAPGDYMPALCMARELVCIKEINKR
jgi:anaphase-promoting complex subunit 6